jgi:ribonuclease Y
MDQAAGIIVLLVGVVVGGFMIWLARREAASLHRRAIGEIDDARARVAEAQTQASALLAEARAEREAVLGDLHNREQRLEAREARLTAQLERLERDQREHEQARVSELADLTERRNRLAEQEQAKLTAWAEQDRAREDEWHRREAADTAARRKELERIAGLTAEQARAELIKEVTDGARRDAQLTVRQIEDEAKREGETLARRIVTDAVQRVAAEQTTESVVTVVQLPGDDMKGRIIGREGRNIRAFEALTGVNLLIDDSPGAVLLSCFDPVRRETARVALEALVADGRIHPQRIEAAYADAIEEVGALIERAGAEAAREVGIHDLHPELVRTLGQLRYRTSYGQNVLGHLIESAHIAGMMAAEIGGTVPLVKRCGAVHDTGEALTHEVEGSHALIGADLARRYGESEEVVHAIAAHHNEVAPMTVEAVLTQASDACSGGRPGARRESLESYVQRLNRLEAIASAHPGVEKVYAMSAGREVRVMVQPDEVDDIGAEVLARDIAKQVSEELTYPGQIRITVVRESRATATAN